MIAMLDTSHDLAVCEEELGMPVEQLLTPLTRFNPQRPDANFVIDNGAFSGFRDGDFRSLIEREKPRRSLCRWVAIPDVVGSALRTYEAYRYYANQLPLWKHAYVCQDGQESRDIPWAHIQAIFIGGTTEWKMSKYAAQCIRCAQIFGKWVHVGRVNTPDRFYHFQKLGANSFDGSGIARYSHMRTAIRDAKMDMQTTMFNEDDYA